MIVSEALQILKQNGYILTEAAEDGLRAYIIDTLKQNPDEGTLEFYSQKASEFAYDLIKSLGYDVTYTSDRDEAEYDVHYIEYKKKVNEDFGIGVGGMTGADQGIPMGGDCKAVVAKRIDGGKCACRFRNMVKRRKNKGK